MSEQNNHEGAKEQHRLISDFADGRISQLEDTAERRQARENLVGATVDVEETKSRNDGMIHLRYAEKAKRAPEGSA